MTVTNSAPGDANDRFQRFLRQGLVVARRHVVGDGDHAPLTEAARERALNLLDYAARTGLVWPETRDLLLTLAPKMERAGHWKGWHPRLQQWITLAEAQGDPLTTATLCRHIGVLHRLQSDHAQAEMYLTQSAELFHAQGQPREQARALNQLGYVAWQKNTLEHATTLAQEALGLLEAGDVEQAMSFSLLGLVARERHQWKQAEEYHHQALALREQTSHLRELAWSLQNLADALRGQGKYEPAIRYFERAIVLLDQVQDPAHRAIVQMNLGIVYSLQAQPFKAFPLYEAAERTFRRVGSRQNLAKLKTNQGLEYMTVESWERAAEAFQLSADIFQRIDSKGEQLNALDGLGLSYLEQGRYTEALALFERINDELPEIEGTYFFPLLRDRLPEQIARSKAGLKTG